MSMTEEQIKAVREAVGQLKDTDGNGLVPLKYKRFDKSLPALYRDNVWNAGYDLFARLNAPVTVKPGQSIKVPLNVATEIPPMAVGLLFQRSSTYDKWSLEIVNGAGVIDSLFRGDGDEWKAQFRNASNQPVTIKNGDKLCQAVFVAILPLILAEVDTLENPDRGGFGTSFDNAEVIQDVGR